MDDLGVRTILTPVTADEAYMHNVAEAKRVLELWTMVPGWKEKFLAAPEDTLREEGLSIDVLSVEILCVHETAEKYRRRPPSEWPVTALRYKAFMREKFNEREKLAKEICVPADLVFREWRNRQLNRCWVELGSRNSAIIHVPVSYELDLGCSVGCPFCGVMAPHLSKVCRYDEENAKLWKDILSYTKERIGAAAGWGTCYYATEPLDNPDYEKFTDAFFEVFGVIPQITTAASLRRPERTRAYLAEAQEKFRRVHRFSVLSLDILHRIFEEFSMDELLLVELLPQFEEAPSNHFTKVGRARENDVKATESESGSTIACITGFVVNMAERSLRLITPCPASEEHPTGEFIIAKEYFADFVDFKKRFEGIIQKYMREELDKTQPLYLRPSLSFKETAEGIEFSSPGILRMKFRGTDDISPGYYQAVLRQLQHGGRSAEKIAEHLLEEENIPPAYVFFILGRFERAGLLLEPYEVKESC